MKKSIVPAIVTAFLLILFVSIDGLAHLGIISWVGARLTPFQIVIADSASSIGGFFGGITKIADLEQDNQRLKAKLDSAIIEIAKLSQDKVDNESLRAGLGLKQSSGLSLVTGEIASFDPSLNSGINGYFDDASGIKEGNMVLANGYMIGTVSKVAGHIVRVKLITDPSSAIPAKIQAKEIAGIATGRIGNGLQLDQVPQGESISKGDSIVTSGLGGTLPAGIMLASINSVQKVSGSIFQKIELEPSVDVLKIHYLMVAK